MAVGLNPSSCIQRTLLSVLLSFLWLLKSAFVVSFSADGLALLEVKQSITEDPHNILDEWKESDALPCNWTGITCSGEEVTAIRLSWANLTGSLPESIGRLKYLQEVSLHGNYFSGSIPSSFVNLTSLEYLDLSFNQFSGTIPSGILKMQSLRRLDLGHNRLSGFIPMDHSLLVYLSLTSNEFSLQNFPAGIANLTTLEYLDLSNCSLTGDVPSSLGDLQKLKELYLQENFLTSIPPSFGGLESLWILDVSRNRLKGSILPELGSMKNISVLRLYGNELTGSIPKELARAAATLQNLDIGINNLSGPVPPELGDLSLLLLLHLQTNQLNGSIPDRFFAKMTVLEDVYLYENHFTGPLPQDLGLVQPLKKFDCSYNAFSGLIPPQFCKGGNQLQRLVLMDNQFGGQIPDTLGDCPALYRLRLNNNRLSGLIPSAFGRSQVLQFLDLNYNDLTGTIPPAFENCSSLQTLRVSGNYLAGSVPVTLNRLVELDASNNFLTGSLQAGLCAKTLTSLDLSYNKLMGVLPQNLPICRQLSQLYLQHNEISGAIPASLGAMDRLQVVNLSHNQLSGTIAKELSASETLQTLDVSYNNLRGPVLVTGFFVALNASFFEGNDGLCGVGDTDVVEPILKPCESAALTSDRGNRLKGVSLALVILAAILTPFLCCLIICLGFCSKLGNDFTSMTKTQDWSMIAFQKLPSLNLTHVLNALDESNIIGIGGSGRVYRGELKAMESSFKPLQFVVKRLKAPVRKRSIFFDHGFRAEVDTLGSVRHFNVVKLLACCTNGETNLLVYEFMENGSLADLLHRKPSALLNWNSRYKIALGAAQGLAYLHHDCSPPILHRDVSSNNVLIDSDFNARLGDFGLAKLVQDPRKQNTVSFLVGSRGYIAPECAFSLKTSEKTDVFSYGVVLLELVTGKRAVQESSGDDEHITLWVQRKAWGKDGLAGVLDPCLHEAWGPGPVQEEMMTLLRIGLFCTVLAPEKRPDMRDVVRMLNDVRTTPRRHAKGAEDR